MKKFLSAMKRAKQVSFEKVRRGVSSVEMLKRRKIAALSGNRQRAIASFVPRRILNAVLAYREGMKPRKFKVVKMTGRRFERELRARRFRGMDDIREAIENIPALAYSAMEYDNAHHGHSFSSAITGEIVDKIKSVDEGQLASSLRNGAKTLWTMKEDVPGGKVIECYFDEKTFGGRDFRRRMGKLMHSEGIGYSKGIYGGEFYFMDIDTLEIRFTPAYGLEGALKTISLSRGLALR